MSSASAVLATDLGDLSEEQVYLLEALLSHPEADAGIVERYPRNFDSGFIKLPASWAQERMWFIDQMQGSSWGYQVPIALRLRGCLDRNALQEALDQLVMRHETLRTFFSNDDGVLSQVISARGEFALKAVDLSNLDLGVREQLVRRHMSEEAHATFDLSSGPLIRGRLLILGAQEHVLLITIHHIVVDGWSKGVLLREIGELYTRGVGDGFELLEPLAVQYADFARWQQVDWQQNGSASEKLEYWRNRLKGNAAQLELPMSSSRPHIQSLRGERVGVALGAQLSEEIKSFARRHAVTPFMVLLAAWAILLSRLSGQDDVVVGSPVANRRRPEFEGIVGLFVNPLVLRIRVSEDSTVAQVLGEIRDTTIGAYEHQDVPYEKIVEAVQPERSESRNPLYQVSFVLHNEPRHNPKLSGLVVSAEEEVDEPAMVDLLLSLEEREGEFVGSAYYASDLFERRTITQWMGYFSTLLRSVLDDVDLEVWKLRLLPESEFSQIIESFNETRAPYRGEVTVHELFEEQAERTPETVAVEHKGRRLTYAQLNAWSNQLARYLLSRGVGPDAVVGLCVERGLDMVVALLGVLKAGGAYLPLDPNYPAERLQQMLGDANPQIVLTETELMEVLPGSAAQVIALDEKLREIAGFIDENLSATQLGLSSGNLVYVIYTSGSTGRPKGTAMRHRSVVNLIEWHRSVFGSGETRRVLQFAALSFDVAFQEIFSTLCTGGTLVLLDEWLRRDVRALTDFLARYSIQRLFVPPLMLQSIAEHLSGGVEVPDSLKDVITAGEQLKISLEIRDLFRRLGGCRLHNHYGPTETHVVTALTLEGDPGKWPDLPAIGRPVANTQIYILDRQLQPVPVGVAGEIYIGGANVAKGYLNRPRLTEQRFMVDPYSTEPHAKLYKTGDLGRWSPEGLLEYLGRNDNQVKIRGFRIELGEIEAQLARHEQVREAAVVDREDRPGEKCLVAYIVPRGGFAPRIEEIREHLKGALPEYMVPSAFVALEKLPLTPNGKLDRRSLPDPDLSAYVCREYEAPKGEVEDTLAEIWRELLVIERVGRNDNFFELGGHSLLGLKLIAAMEKRLGARLSPAVMFRHPTLAALAKTVTEQRQAQLNSGEEEWTI